MNCDDGVNNRYNMYRCIIIGILLIFGTSCSNYNDPQAVPQGQFSRIISLSPSITRQIVDLQSESVLAGVTSYHPPLGRKIQIIGTLLHPNLEKIIIIKPDLVLLSEEDSAVQNSDRLKRIGVGTYIFKKILTLMLYVTIIIFLEEYWVKVIWLRVKSLFIKKN